MRENTLGKDLSALLEMVTLLRTASYDAVLAFKDKDLTLTSSKISEFKSLRKIVDEKIKDVDRTISFIDTDSLKVYDQE